MKQRMTQLTQTRTSILASLAFLCSLSVSTPVFTQDHEHSNQISPAKLVRDVQDATRGFLDVNNLPVGYQPLFGCVSGPDHGAMGIHYVNLALVGDGRIDLSQPEAVIYEPVGRARRLVGVEYIVDAPTWLADPANNGLPPQLDGQAFQLVGVPNRFGIPSPFFELHVWAWRDNPQGAFVDWNNNVTCERQ
jgi:hypothetical protein